MPHSASLRTAPSNAPSAEIKFAQVNEAFEVVREAKFPSIAPGGAPSQKVEAEPAPAPSLRRPAPSSAQHGAPPPRGSNIEFVPRRRVRWSIVLLLVGAVGVGAYVAVDNLARRAAPERSASKTSEPTPMIRTSRGERCHDAADHLRKVSKFKMPPSDEARVLSSCETWPESTL